MSIMINHNDLYNCPYPRDNQKITKRNNSDQKLHCRSPFISRIIIVNTYSTKKKSQHNIDCPYFPLMHGSYFHGVSANSAPILCPKNTILTTLAFHACVAFVSSTSYSVLSPTSVCTRATFALKLSIPPEHIIYPAFTLNIRQPLLPIH